MKTTYVLYIYIYVNPGSPRVLRLNRWSLGDRKRKLIYLGGRKNSLWTSGVNGFGRRTNYRISLHTNDRYYDILLQIITWTTPRLQFPSCFNYHKPPPSGAGGATLRLGAGAAAAQSAGAHRGPASRRRRPGSSRCPAEFLFKECYVQIG